MSLLTVGSGLAQRSAASLAPYLAASEPMQCQLSPGGAALACALTGPNGQSTLQVGPVARFPGQAVQPAKMPAGRIEAIQWASDAYLAFVLTPTGTETQYLYAYNVGKDELQRVPGTNPLLVDPLWADERQVLARLDVPGESALSVYEVDLKKGRIDMRYGGQATTPYTHFLTDHNGKLKVAWYDTPAGRTLARRREDELAFQNVVQVPHLLRIEPLFFAANNRDLYVMAPNKEGVTEVQLLSNDLLQVKSRQGQPKVGILGASWSYKEQALAEVRWADEQFRRECFLPRWSNLYTRLTQLNPLGPGDTYWRFTAYDAAEEVFVVAAIRPDQPAVTFLYQAATDQLTRLSPATNGLETPGPQWQGLAYQSIVGDADMLVYVLFPEAHRVDLQHLKKTPPSVKLPVVLYLPEEPFQVQGPGYNPVARLLADSGYLVVMPQPSYLSTIRRLPKEKRYVDTWFQLQQDLYAELLAKLANQHLIDPDRVMVFAEGLQALPGLMAAGSQSAIQPKLVALLQPITQLEALPEAPPSEPLQTALAIWGDPSSPNAQEAYLRATQLEGLSFDQTEVLVGLPEMLPLEGPYGLTHLQEATGSFGAEQLRVQAQEDWPMGFWQEVLTWGAARGFTHDLVAVPGAAHPDESLPDKPVKNPQQGRSLLDDPAYQQFRNQVEGQGR